MFTQCAQCETIFKLTADVLGAAGGQVRCGRCGEVFNALTRLAEEPGAFTVGESRFELESRADQILESSDELPAARTGTHAQVQVDEYPDGEDLDDRDFASLEIQPDPISPEEFPLPGAEDGQIYELDEHGDLVVPDFEPAEDFNEIFVESPKEAAAATAAAVAATTAAVAVRPVEAASVEPPAEQVHPAEAHPSEPLAPSAAPANPFATDPPVPVARRALFASLAVIFTLTLAAQVIHQNREWLAQRSPLGPWLQTIYTAIGMPLPTPLDLSVYQLRQWGVTGEPAASGTLRVRASILNIGTGTQPFPLLRVALADRFGRKMAAREFEPADYLGRPATGMMRPGERVDATLDLVDPGKGAEGFEIDVCLRGAARRLACAGDSAPHAP